MLRATCGDYSSAVGHDIAANLKSDFTQTELAAGLLKEAFWAKKRIPDMRSGDRRGS